MYCKNCGRQLKEGARFCDRCGQSVRQNNQPSERETKRREIENLKKERLNRKKRIAYKEERELRKKEKKKEHKKANIILIFIFAVLMLALLSAIISYHMNVSDEKTPLGEIPAETAVPASPSPTAVIHETAADTHNDGDKKDGGKNDGTTDGSTGIDGDYEVFNISGAVCPYPKSFTAKAADGDAKLSLTDNAGGASMMIFTDEGAAAPTTELMRDFASDIGGNVIDSRAGSSGYSVTAERDNIVYHRKYVIVGDGAVYYDFQYSTGSVRAAQYQENIDYIDSVMDGSENSK